MRFVNGVRFALQTGNPCRPAARLFAFKQRCIVFLFRALGLMPQRIASRLRTIQKPLNNSVRNLRKKIKVEIRFLLT